MKKILCAAVAAATLASCASTSDVLNDQTFTLVELNGTEYVSVGEEPAVIIFADGRLNANLGGNSITATYKAGQDGSLELSYGASTKMLVPDEYREDEFVAALNSVRSFALDGDVVSLLNGEGTVVVKAEKK